MPSIPTPNYVLTVAHTIQNGPYDSFTLPQGSFVRPIDPRYIPQHVLDNPKYKYFNKEYELFVYTKHGIIVVPKSIVRQT